MFTVKPRSHWSTHQEAFVILVNTLTFIKNKTNIYTREMSELHLARFLYTPPPKGA